jgi:hypothetical protein
MCTDAPLSFSIGAGTDDIGGDGASREGPGEFVGVVEKSRRLLGLLGLEGAVRVAPLIPKLKVSLPSTLPRGQLTWSCYRQTISLRDSSQSQIHPLTTPLWLHVSNHFSFS